MLHPTIQLHHSSGSSFVFKQALAISMGEGRNIVVENQDNGHEITGRLEFLPMGEFTGGGDYFGSDLKREKTPKLSIGVTGDYNANTVRSRGNLGSFILDTIGNYRYNSLKTAMVDLMFKYNGWSVASEYAIRGTVDKNVDGFGNGNGFVIQSGYLLPSNWEFAGRFTEINSGSNSSIKESTEYTFGISKYLKGHNLKIQTDYSYQDIPGGSNETIFRFQTELAF